MDKATNTAPAVGTGVTGDTTNSTLSCAGSNLTWAATYQLFMTGSPTTLVGLNP